MLRCTRQHLGQSVTICTVVWNAWRRRWAEPMGQELKTACDWSISYLKGTEQRSRPNWSCVYRIVSFELRTSRYLVLHTWVTLTPPRPAITFISLQYQNQMERAWCNIQSGGMNCPLTLESSRTNGIPLWDHSHYLVCVAHVLNVQVFIINALSVDLWS